MTSDDVDPLPSPTQAEEAQARAHVELDAVLAKLGFEERREV